MELVVQPLDRTFRVEPGSNLLETLRQLDVPLSYSCMAGRCGTCRCKVVDGNVLESGREAKITNPNDDRYVLACMSVLTESCTIEIPEPDEIVTHPARIIKASVIAIEDMTHDIKRLRLTRPSPWSFHRVSMQPYSSRLSIFALIQWLVSVKTRNWNSMSVWCQEVASPATSQATSKWEMPSVSAGH